MCGIAGFLGNSRPLDSQASRDWLDRSVALLSAGQSDELGAAERVLDLLDQAFADVMSFSTYYLLTKDAGFVQSLESLTQTLEQILERARKRPGAAERTLERLRDTTWQLRREVLQSRARVEGLIPQQIRAQAGMAAHYLAWCVELVIQSIERLEVRGRDSAGISVQLEVNRDGFASIAAAHGEALRERRRYQPELDRAILVHRPPSGAPVVAFVYKVANIIGRLGDNTQKLRRLIHDDELLWQAAAELQRINVIAHTRWASNGIISIGNCHPLDASTPGADDLDDAERGASFALNGDVDNHLALKAELSRQIAFDDTVTTDAKIPPVLLRFQYKSRSLDERFADVLSACEGSLALLMQHPSAPDRLFLGRKGAGQDLFAARTTDGWMVASELHGVVPMAREAKSVMGHDFGGIQLTLSADGSERARTLKGDPIELPAKPIGIHASDIYRGDYPYYLLKELNEAPTSIRRTLRGKYELSAKAARFLDEGMDSYGPLLERLRSRTEPFIDRILIIGQGTASIAAMGVSQLARAALANAPVQVSWSKSSEVCGFQGRQAFNSTLLVPISQSGTTTDTNRTVDLASAGGAWVHAIVNRRQSWLANHAHSRTYTSDGRDVEMAVASTKAFYSQIAAGKLLALLLGLEYRTLKPEQVAEELRELETLAEKVESVLARQEDIAAIVHKFALRNANWAVVGNGSNKVAAEEIRIKLSELCYKSIPCDFTEDKKHIDLSTEPLTLMIANDLEEAMVSDTAKEAAIFRAHGGTPIVMCVEGESRFSAYASACIELPAIGAGLGFVLATVAGHLWGFAAARAIDERAAELRLLRALFSEQLRAPERAKLDEIGGRLGAVLDQIADRQMNAALMGSTVAKLGTLHRKLSGSADLGPKDLEQGLLALNEAVDALTRPIDSIRHQAKTVTVGISRPQESLSPAFRDGFRRFGANIDDLNLTDLAELRAVSPLVANVRGGVKYRIETGLAGQGEPQPVLTGEDKFGSSAGVASRYDAPSPAQGTKRRALRLQRAVWGRDASTGSPFVIVPLHTHDGSAPSLILLHVDFLPTAPLPLKMAVLRALGSRLEELEELLAERAGPSLEQFVVRLSPADLVVAPPQVSVAKEAG